MSARRPSRSAQGSAGPGSSSAASPISCTRAYTSADGRSVEADIETPPGRRHYAGRRSENIGRKANSAGQEVDATVEGSAFPDPRDSNPTEALHEPLHRAAWP